LDLDFLIKSTGYEKFLDSAIAVSNGLNSEAFW